MGEEKHTKGYYTSGTKSLKKIQNMDTNTQVEK
jgi:hypothetical protein